MNNSIPFNINVLYLIASPRRGEEGVARRLVENISDVSNSGGHFNFTTANIYTAEGFFRLLDEVYRGIKKDGIRPMLHFDMHGSLEDGLEIGPSGEFIDWETVIECLRFLNIELKNELVVVITACHGLYTILPISLEKEAPFLCLIAPEGEITMGTIEDNVPKFYQELFQSGSLVAACGKLGSAFNYFHSAEFLFKILIRYFKEQCKGIRGKKRKEELLTMVMQTSLGDFPENLSIYRVQIKRYLAPSQEVLNRYTRRFLIGKAAEIKIDDLLKEIDKSSL